MKSRYFAFIFCAGSALLWLFGKTAVEVLLLSRPADAIPLSLTAHIGVVLAALIAAVSLLQLTINLINSIFFVEQRPSDELCLRELGPIQVGEPDDCLPSLDTIARHAASSDPYWQEEAKRISRPKRSPAELVC